MVLSLLPLAKVFPSGLNATDKTSSECPLSVFTFFPVSIDQSWIVLSLLPLAKVFPSVLKATE
jgi:hypothetical protein